MHVIEFTNLFIFQTVNRFKVLLKMYTDIDIRETRFDTIDGVDALGENPFVRMYLWFQYYTITCIVLCYSSKTYIMQMFTYNCFRAQ